MSRGYFGIGVWHAKTPQNLGTLLRSAHAFGAAFVFTVGARWPKQSSDVWQSWKHVPVYQHDDLDSLIAHLPYSCPLVGVELTEGARELPGFSHPERACYLLGAEDHGLSRAAIERCHAVVRIPGAAACLNVASAGSILMFHRYCEKNTSQGIPPRAEAAPGCP